MVYFQLDREIHRPPEVVFAYLTDFDRQPQWQPGVLESGRLPAGEPRVGTTVRKVRRTPMGRVTFTDEITKYDPGRSTYAERVIDSMIRGSGSRWRVERTEGGSRLRVDVQVRLMTQLTSRKCRPTRRIRKTPLSTAEKRVNSATVRAPVAWLRNAKGAVAILHCLPENGRP
jgi:hypothetical protein